MNGLANIDVEQAVLGSLLVNPATGFIAKLLVPDDFTADHRVIFEAISMAIEEGRAPHPPTLAPSLKSLRIGPLDGAQYLGRLMTASVAPAHLPDYVRSLKEFTARRILAQLSANMQGVATNVEIPLAEFVAYATSELDTVASALRRQRQTVATIGDMAQEAVERLKAGKKAESIHTGLVDLNRIIGGWHRGELTIIAGRPSMGKSAFVLSTLRLAALRGASSLFFSMEMQKDAVSSRMLADGVWNSQTPIPYNRIDAGKLTPHEVDRLSNAAQELDKLPMTIDVERGLSVSEIGARARRKQDELGARGDRLDIIAVDHLGKVKASDRYAGNKVHEVGEKTNALADMAAQMDVAVIALCQLNRGVEGREDKRPGLADMRDSGNIEEDADTVAFLYRPAYYLERTHYDDPGKEIMRENLLESKRSTLELIVSKNRRGPICTQEFFIDVASNVVRDRV